MIDVEFFKWLAAQGGVGTLAAVIFFFYRKDMLQSTAQWKGQTELLVQVVQNTTAAITHNTAVVQSLHQHLSDGERRDWNSR